jgi:hypothetical protein
MSTKKTSKTVTVPTVIEIQAEKFGGVKVNGFELVKWVVTDSGSTTLWSLQNVQLKLHTVELDTAQPEQEEIVEGEEIEGEET